MCHWAVTASRPARASRWQRSGPIQEQHMAARSNKGRLSDFCLPLYLLLEAEFMPFVDSLRKRPERGDNELAGYTGLSCKVRLFKVAMICSRTGDTFYNVTQRVGIAGETYKDRISKKRTHSPASSHRIYKEECGPV